MSLCVDIEISARPGLVLSKSGPKISWPEKLCPASDLGHFIKIKVLPFQAFLGPGLAGYPHPKGQIDKPSVITTDT